MHKDIDRDRLIAGGTYRVNDTTPFEALVDFGFPLAGKAVMLVAAVLGAVVVIDQVLRHVHP